MASRSSSASAQMTRPSICAGPDEALVHRMAEEGEEVVEVAVDVEDAAALVVDAELRPGDRFHELLAGAEPPWQHDERVRQLGHERLALVHGRDHVEIAEGAVRDLVPGQGLGDHARRPSACRDGSVGHHAHQPDRGAAVDEADATLGQPGAEALGGRCEGGVRSGAGPAEHAYGGRRPHAGSPRGPGPPPRGADAAGRRRRRTIVSAASLSWMESENAAPARAKSAAVRNARW